MFFCKSDIKKKKKTAGKLATEVRTGDAPKPPFSTKSIEKSKKKEKEINPLTGKKKKPYFLV